MKQRITVEQWNELNDKQKKRLKEWWEPQEGDWITYMSLECLIMEDPSTWRDIKSEAFPLLSIGQMIEFMQSLKNDWYPPDWNDSNICDQLWSIIKCYL